tara:strand:+ start:1721 stop:3049 length:1329 start_codon:yes stop_codon:yes gene_type:complete
MISYTNKFLILIFSLLPLFLITGPAIPDIIISFTTLYFIILYFLVEKKYSILNERFFLISIIFWISIIFISFFAYSKFKSLQDSFIFIRLLLIPLCGYYFIFNKQQYLVRAIKIIFFVILFVLIDSLYQFFNYSAENGFGSDLLGFKSNWYGRLTGPFKDELVPGSYVAKFSFIGFIYFLLKKDSKNIKICSIIYLVMIGVVCFVSGERMAIATFLLGMLILILFLKEKRFIFLSSLIFIIVINFTIYKLHPFYNDYKVIESSQYHQGLKVEKYISCPDNSEKKDCKKTISLQPSFIEVIKNFNSSAYGEIYNLSFEMFKSNPLTGVGISNFKYVCENDEKYKSKMVNFNCASHPHNLYLQWLSEGGIFIFILFILYLYFLILIILKSENKYFKIISLTTIIMLFWPLMSTGSLIKNWNGVLTFFIIALCLSITKLKIDILK